MRFAGLVIAGAALLCVPTATADLPPKLLDDSYHDAPANNVPTPNNNNDAGPDICDVINTLKGFEPGSSRFLNHNRDADRYWLAEDAVWTDLEGTVAFLGLGARYKNVLGIYTDLGRGLRRKKLLGPYSGFGLAGDGTADAPFPAARLDLVPGKAFGWYLHADGRVFLYSEEKLNRGRWDHMMAYRLGPVSTHVRYPDGKTVLISMDQSFLLAWEDMPWNGETLGDDDYDDMMYLVGKVMVVATVTD